MNNETKVFIVYWENRGYDAPDELFGVFSTRDNAEMYIQQTFPEKGFGYTRDQFYIDEVVVDEKLNNL